jgi:hypothetical protein
MLGQLVRAVARLLISVVLGAGPGAFYGVVVGAVHFGAYGRWNGIPAFVVGSISIGALFGLVAGIGWAFSADPEALTDTRPLPGRENCLPGSAGDGLRGRGRQPGCAGQHAATHRFPARRGSLTWLSRGFETPN